MPSWLSWIIAFARGILGIREDAAVANAKEAGADEQALKDTGSAYDTLTKAADARADADTQRVLREPDSAQPDANAAKDFPGVEFRD